MSDTIYDDKSILEPMDIPAAQRMAAKASTMVDYVSNLDIYSKANRMRLSGIVCTIGPVIRSPETLLELIENGMNVARMNFSHGLVNHSFLKYEKSNFFSICPRKLTSKY